LYDFNGETPLKELAESVSLKKLLVLATIREALDVSWKNRRALLVWIIVCVIVSVLSQYGLVKFLTSIEFYDKNLSNLSGMFWVSKLLVIPNVAIYSVFAVLCHRFILLKGQQEEIVG
jgi:hypothetical protein